MITFFGFGQTVWSILLILLYLLAFSWQVYVLLQSHKMKGTWIGVLSSVGIMMMAASFLLCFMFRCINDVTVLVLFPAGLLLSVVGCVKMRRQLQRQQLDKNKVKDVAMVYWLLQDGITLMMVLVIWVAVLMCSIQLLAANHIYSMDMNFWDLILGFL